MLLQNPPRLVPRLKRSECPFVNDSIVSSLAVNTGSDKVLHYKPTAERNTADFATVIVVRPSEGRESSFFVGGHGLVVELTTTTSHAWNVHGLGDDHFGFDVGGAKGVGGGDWVLDFAGGVRGDGIALGDGG